MSTCTCSPCGRVFTSLSGFDAHQERRFEARHATTVIITPPSERTT